MMRIPECSVCGTELELTQGGWRCPVDGFFYNINRGKVGVPLLGPTEVGPPEQAGVAGVPVEKKGGDEFMEWIAERGVTREMYNDLDETNRRDLKTAFYQRHSGKPDVTLLPPMK